ncbi:MAG: phosphotransferase [Acidobacteria bacterium]|nr:phosphotransferase [Acidobacteriota bacterium]
MTEPSNIATAVRERIDRFLDASVSERQGATIVRLTGDAGDRQYVRVLRDGAASQVLAIHPGPIAFDALPFTNVAALMHAMPVPIPRILGHSDALGIIALEDLGDVTLQTHIETAPADARADLYRQAVTLIGTIQRRGRELASPAHVPYGIAFDEEKLVWELQFFTTHFLVAHRRAALTDRVTTALTREYAEIASELAASHRVLCHRDYHSRNLMVHDARLYIIDFQDARMGPDTYDLVSLLRDSYADLDGELVEALIDHFLTERAAPGEDALAFRRRFDLMALQRNLKALGTFGFQSESRGSSTYLPFIPRTLDHVRANLAAYPRFGRLQTMLAEYLPELRQ